jgi:hypothetical protein
LSSAQFIEKASHAALEVGGNIILTSPGAWPQLADSLDDIDKAEQELNQLDEQMRAAMFVSGLNIMIGASNCVEAAEDIRTIEKARQRVLARIGVIEQ